MRARCAIRNSPPTDRRRASPLVALLFALSLGPGNAAARASDPVIAQVGSQELTAGDFSKAIATLDPEVRRKAAGDHKALLDLVRAELGRRAILAEAHDRHWDKRPDIVARAERAREDVIITSFLATQTTPPSDFPGDAAIREVYEANLSRFMKPREYHVAQIYIARPDKARAEDLARTRARAAAIVDKARKPGADFSTLARHESDDHDSAAQGGDLGWVPETQLLPEIARTLAGLGDNEVSDPVEVADGWHILHELGTKPAVPEPLDKMRPAIVKLLRDRESARLGEAHVGELLARGHAEVDLDAVRSLVEQPTR